MVFIGDIESIFYQVKVPDSQRSFPRYQWCNNNDLNGEVADYEMDVNVLGSTSSPGYCGYILRRTAINNEQIL